MDISRRTFLGGAIAVAGALALPKIAGMPTIYGDDIHDDWEGIDALFNGRPVKMLTEAIRVGPDGLVEMVGGSFRLSKTLDLSGSSTNIRLIRSRLTWTEPVDVLINFRKTGFEWKGSGCGLRTLRWSFRVVPFFGTYLQHMEPGFRKLVPNVGGS